MVTPSAIRWHMVVLERSNARCVCAFHWNGLVGFKRSRNGCIVGAIEKAYATWLTKPNQARTSVMFFGVGKPVMASRYFCDGLTSDGVMVNPANFTSSCAKRNLRGFSVIPFSAQVCNHSVAWWYASSMDSLQRRASSIHCIFRPM